MILILVAQKKTGYFYILACDTVCKFNLQSLVTEMLTSPASIMRPISSSRPMLSKSITTISNELSSMFVFATLKLNASLNIGLSVHLTVFVFRFSARLSGDLRHSFTYGSVRTVHQPNRLVGNYLEIEGHILTIKGRLYTYTNIVFTVCNELQLSWLSVCGIS
jgi:hypothetical protein